MVAQVLHNNQTQLFANSSVPVFFYSDNPQADIVEGEAAGINGEVENSQHLNKRMDNKGYKDSKKKTNRCTMRRKRVSSVAVGLYCGIHRYSDRHDCSFDYRDLGAQEIRRNNPVVTNTSVLV
ncbi:AN1-type zinc finger protein 6 [Homalodisca vitripennis]|nr:AN1-type zinc finger protein 6 [Homalodisca vitripennis]